MAKKYDYITSLVASIEEKVLREIVTEFAKSEKTFEAFVIEKSGKTVDTGQNFDDFVAELAKLMKKCRTRRGFFKVTRLNNAGLSSFHKNLVAHFSNENFETAAWMSLALMDMLHQVILSNIRYRTYLKPYKTFEKVFIDCKERLDSSLKVFKPGREYRAQLFKTLVDCWWREQERDYEQTYFSPEDLFTYAERDEDYLALQESFLALQESALTLDKNQTLHSSAWKRFWGEFAEPKNEEDTYEFLIDSLLKKSREEMDEWK
ncbi:MAG: hypothetical protein P1V18_02570 [Candidatus Gracilibacteria bacterium]|nr:hypothetical protein [Candidatus Gracilibacteria bacterium]